MTMDATSLYSNIPHEEGMLTCKNFLRTRGFSEDKTQDISNSIWFIRTHNNFVPNGHQFFQDRDTAMGTYSQLPGNEICWVDTTYKLYTLKFIDDILFMRTHCEKGVHDFKITSTIQTTPLNLQWDIPPFTFRFWMYWYV